MGSKLSVVSHNLPHIEGASLQLRPLLYYSLNHIEIFDFVKNKLFSIDRCTPIHKYRPSFPNVIETSRAGDKITINLLSGDQFLKSLEIDLGISSGKKLSTRSPLDENKLIIQLSSRKIYNQYINWGEDIALYCYDPNCLHIVQNRVNISEIYMRTKGDPHLIKLHPRSNDPYSKYTKYFCWFDNEKLQIGTIRDDKLDTKLISNRFLGDVDRFFLTDDNMLMLFILIKDKYGDKFTQDVMFIDCNKVEIVHYVKFNRSFYPLWDNQAPRVMVELPPIKKDYLTLQRMFTPLLTSHFPHVLAVEIFSYLYVI
ncbi:MAG: hypothetical protein Harvfovirus3_26 [Harvfovirus sp.]|uniref:Uncharacterized protein n=1 Tax=Harvfovirus sp. TaxID=2487768 RepID=A0A3G5A313_9VIRU|nr:MAG: hypothetical protein Harvfovirus3_26 [Harvfovirus sp.]